MTAQTKEINSEIVRAALLSTLAVYAFASGINGTTNADRYLALAVLVAGYAAPIKL